MAATPNCFPEKGFRESFPDLAKVPEILLGNLRFFTALLQGFTALYTISGTVPEIQGLPHF